MSSIFSDPTDVSQSVRDFVSSHVGGLFKTKRVPRPDDFASGIKFTEYVAGVPDERKALTLLGNFLPFQPFGWSGDQRLVKTYYPGNPEPSIHVMGAKEGPTTIKGRFKDKKFDPDKVKYGISYLYAQAFDEMRKRGNLIKIEMLGAEGHDWVRWGLLEHSDFQMNKLSWIEYTLELFIIGPNQPINNYFAEKEKSIPLNVNQNLITASLQFAKLSAPATVPLSISGILNGGISDVASAINLVTGFVGGIISTGQDISAASQRALGLIKNLRATVSKFKRDVEKIKLSFQNLSSNGSPVGQFKDTFTGIRFILNTHYQLQPIHSYLSQMEAQFQKLALTVPLRRYKVVVGDNLQKISIRFYGKSDNWIDIFKHNNLQSTVLIPGKVLEIPKL